MLGSIKKPRPFGIDDAGQPPMDMGDFAPAPPVRGGGLLAQGSPGQAALGAVLDSIATQTGGQAQFAPLMKERRDRENALADWQAKFAFQQANKAPEYGEFGNALIQSGIKPGSPEWVSFFAKKRDNTVDPWTNIVTGGETIMGRQSQVQQALGGGDPASSGGADWTSAFSPQELEVMKAEAARRGAGANIPNGDPTRVGAPVRVSSEAQYKSLPPGTRFIAPDGSMRVKN